MSGFGSIPVGDGFGVLSDGSMYVNVPGFHEAHEEMFETTDGDAYDRLLEVKASYDPENVFGDADAL